MKNKEFTTKDFPYMVLGQKYSVNNLSYILDVENILGEKFTFRNGVTVTILKDSEIPKDENGNTDILKIFPLHEKYIFDFDCSLFAQSNFKGYTAFIYLKD